MLVRRLTIASAVLVLGAAAGSACSSNPTHPPHLDGSGSGGTYPHKDSGPDRSTDGQAGTDAGDASLEAEASAGSGGTSGSGGIDAGGAGAGGSDAGGADAGGSDAGGADAGGTDGGGSGGTAGVAGTGGVGGIAGMGGVDGGDGGPPAHCSNNQKDQGETDVDCGGPCPPCATGLGCTSGSDCQSLVCDSTNKTCNAPSCSDYVKNGSETDVDCGGNGGCNPCGAGESCLLAKDCSSGVCSGTPLKCQPPTCKDGVKNGSETDVDCGGGSCAKCGRGSACNYNSDCAYDVCGGAPTLTCQCPAGMITVPLVGGGGGSFCIDKYEVSYADYTLFYNNNPVPKTAACNWKTNYTPTANWPSSDVNLPVRNVDWCDAYGYCQAVGKRLCGQIGGGAGSYSSYTDAKESQWFDACSAQGQSTYPYGSSFMPAQCNGYTADDAGITSKLLDANRSPNSCQGGEFFLYDMSGNAAEWTDECQTASSGSPQADTCRVRGGSYLEDNANLACAAPRTMQRNADTDDVGFRCCLD